MTQYNNKQSRVSQDSTMQSLLCNIPQHLIIQKYEWYGKTTYAECGQLEIMISDVTTHCNNAPNSRMH